MRALPTLTTLLGAAMLAACSSGNDAVATADTTMAAAPAAMSADPDAVTAGGGVPAGYLGQVDPPREGRQPADLAQAHYETRDGRWEVTTGPAHIVYAAADTASGNYTATAMMDQLENPEHPEAFGIFIGGSNLDQLTGQTYTYFIVRHTGEYMVRVREGATTRTVSDWTASPDVPKSSDDGKAAYKLTAKADADSVHFMVNDKQVTAVARASVPSAGVVGMRINHSLHLLVTPPTISR